VSRGCWVGIRPGADATCFEDYLTVPDDPRFRTTAGQGWDTGYANYDTSLPSSVRSDSANGLVDVCVTAGAGGTAAAGSSCAFPFTYETVTYNACTDANVAKRQLWCSTTSGALDGSAARTLFH
jgi:subtilisin family serine protease